MARPKPLGFDNWRTFSFVSSDGSGLSFFRKASFGVTVGGFHKLFAGPSIVSTTAHGTEPIITTAEPHGYAAGRSVRIHNLPGSTSGTANPLNGDRVITEIVSTTKFKVAADTDNAEAAVTAGSFVVGRIYTIVSAGSTDFTLIGAANSAVGTVFQATGVGAGTGTALRGFSTLDSGIVGVDIEASIDDTKYSMVPGDLCINEHPEAWEMPLVG